MKKLLTVIAIMALVLTSGCTSWEGTGDNGNINVVCTVFPQYDFVRSIGGTRVNVTMLLPPGSEAHSYEPTPKDIISIMDADLFVAIGGDSEHWAMHLLEGQELKDTPTLMLMDKTVNYTSEHKEGMENAHHHSHSHKDGESCSHSHIEEYDEHIWTSPQNAIIMCEEICSALCSADKKNASYYKENALKYIDSLKKLQRDYSDVIKNGKRQTLVFGDRFPLRYMVEEYGLNYYAAFPGCSSKTEPDIDTIVFLTEKIKEEDIPVIFYMDYSDGRTAHSIADECGIKAMRLYSCHNLSKEDFTDGKTYIYLMEQNLKAIEEALC